jgi:polyisoprenoid-binding protein YceI
VTGTPWFTRLYAAPALLAVALLAACANPSAAPAPAAPPPAAPAAGAPAPTNQPVAAPRPAEDAARPAPGAPAADVPTTSNVMRYAFVADGSEARFRAREQLVGRTLPSDAIGRTRAVTGAVALDGSGAIVPGDSRITVDLRQLSSDESRRDRFISQNTLQVQQFPTADFVPTEVRGLPSPLPATGDVAFQLAGNLTVHGVTRPAVWDARAQLSGSQATGTATTTVKITDFGMELPRAGPVLSIEDTLTLEVDFRVARDAGADLTQADRPRGT